MKKLLILLSIIFLTSCSIFNRNSLLVNPNNAGSKDYIYVIRNYKPREKNEENTVDDENFNEFLNDFFVDSYKNSYISSLVKSSVSIKFLYIFFTSFTIYAT